jgi:PPOX class probable F420-dependent enzyme
MGIELDEDDRWELLANHAIMRLATCDPDGQPHNVPVWYVSDPDRESIYFATPGNSRKARNLRADPRVSLTVDEGESYFELLAVLIEGEAQRVSDEREASRIEEMWSQKYFDQSKVPDFMHHFFDGELTWYRVDPETWSSWDNSQIDRSKLE